MNIGCIAVESTVVVLDMPRHGRYQNITRMNTEHIAAPLYPTGIVPTRNVSIPIFDSVGGTPIPLESYQSEPSLAIGGSGARRWSRTVGPFGRRRSVVSFTARDRELCLP